LARERRADISAGMRSGIHRTPDAADTVPLSRVDDGSSISPRMTALFGGLLGLATMASIFALLIQVFPVEDQRAQVAEAAERRAAAAAASSGQSSAGRKEKPRGRVLLPEPWRISKLKGTHRMARGTMKRRSFIVALEEAGVPKDQIYRVLKSMEGVRKFDRTGKNDKFVVAMEHGSKKVTAFEYIVDPTEIYQSRNHDGLLRGERLDMKVREQEVVASIYVGQDFEKSYRAAGLEKGLERAINKAFHGQTSTESFEEGGTVRAIFLETTALGRFVRYGGLRAIEYRPPDPSNEPVRGYFFEGEHSSGYVDARGRRPSNKGWRSPIPGAPVTSQFNPKRMHPVLKKVMPHNGTDFGAPSGTPVYAAFRGKVTHVGYRGASGNLVLVEHPDGVVTGYAHLSRFAKGLKAGQKVGTRQLVGYVGSTGRSTGPHLHFSAKRNGRFFDALTLKLDALILLPIEERSVFMRQKRELDAQLDAIKLPDPPPPEPEPEPEPEAGATPSAAARKSDGDVQARQDAEAEAEAQAAAKGSRGDDDGDSLLGDDLSGDLE
jgi:murein DD-endopeptidase MepM/ murein hydrolase activator NlpD